MEMVGRREECGLGNLRVVTVPWYWRVPERLSVVCDAAGVMLARGSSEGWCL